MVELIGAVGSLAKTIAPALSLSRLALRQLRLFGTVEIGWFELEDSVKWLSVSDLADLEAFLKSRDSRAVLSLLAITLLTPQSDWKEASLKRLRGMFINNAKRWKADSPNHWASETAAIWQMVCRVYDATTVAGKTLESAALEFTDFVSAPIGRAARKVDGDGRYIERLADLCSRIDEVVAARDAADSIRSALSDLPIAPIITYPQGSVPATFDDLYVSRTLVNEGEQESGEPVSVDGVGAPYRAVVHGAPGAGKSTFVRHLRQELTNREDGQPVLLTTVRNYFPGARDQTILEHLHTSLRTTLNIELPELSLRNALTLGFIVVVFDGLDEITDLGLRVEMVERITSFAREYPAVSVLVTSRSVGYERAPLPSATFKTLILDQYTEPQSTEYVSRWFTFIGRPDLIADFERESQSVLDLKSNPLLLSLLCVLYRERGSIPRRRRDIYAQCADLLFHTWDSHRHINQPEELHANGDRIMQEIARWVYDSPSAQRGLSESVIQKSIGIYLKDHVGVNEGEARRRAGEFLEFCATRAWLLGATGTQFGERVFGFTHRTFFEYFTAEAFSRRNSDPEEIARALIDAHARDATSVLPELLLQAFDEKAERGASRVFEHVCRLSEDELLIFRLMDGVPLPAKARAVGFARIFERWIAKREITEASFGALLGLNPDARGQFIDEYLKGGSADVIGLFVAGWASLELLGEAERFRPMWADSVREIATSYRPIDGESFSRSVETWLWAAGHIETLNPGPAPHLVVPSASGIRIGPAWIGLELMSKQPNAEVSPLHQQLFADVEGFAKRKQNRVSSARASSFAEAVGRRLNTVPLGLYIDELMADEGRWAYFYSVGVLHEATRWDEDAGEALKSLLSSDARALWEIRDAAADLDSGDQLQLSPQMKRVLKGAPKWLTSWARGTSDFVGDVDKEIEFDDQD